jgi:hypothetical protein
MNVRWINLQSKRIMRDWNGKFIIATRALQQEDVTVTNVDPGITELQHT